MISIVHIALLGWIAVVPLLFAMMNPRRAVLVAFLFAWLFLPQGAIVLSGVPDVTKVTATSFGALLGVLLFDAGRLLRFRPTWVDLPVIIWCLSPMISSISNRLGPGAGVYDGASEVLSQIALWGVPYLIGRLYFNTLESLRDLAVAIFVGGLIYVPLCLIELRMSPQLHRLVYGFHPSHFAMTYRFGGWRPMVFMQHGLMVGLWMSSASLVGVWLWSSGAVRQLRNIPMSFLVPLLVIVAILCKSVGALLLLVGGLGLLFGGRIIRRPYLLLLALAIAPTYVIARGTQAWDARQLVELAGHISPEKSQSIQVRLVNEDMLAARAAGRPLFGWGSWGMWRVRDEETGEDITVSDGMWIITLGKRGAVGLAALTITLLLPVLLLLRRIRVAHWAAPRAAPAAAIAILLILFSLDNLFNAMLNPIYMLGAGALTGFYVLAPRLAMGAPAQSPLPGAAARRSAPVASTAGL